MLWALPSMELEDICHSSLGTSGTLHNSRGLFPACLSMPITPCLHAQTLDFSRHVSTLHCPTAHALPSLSLQIQGPALLGQTGCVIRGKLVNLSKQFLHSFIKSRGSCEKFLIMKMV